MTAPSGAAPAFLVLGAGTYYVPVVRRIRELGYRTVVVDRDPTAPALALADVAAAVDITDREGVLRIARANRVAGVMAVNDFGVRSAAHVASALGLVGLDPDSAEAANDKGRMRDRWRAAGLPIPDYRVVGSIDEAGKAAAELGYPLVLKPTDCGGGGRGVSILRTAEDLAWAYDLARPFVDNGRFIIERYLDGTELTVESISWRGQVHVLAVSDKVKPPLRTRVALSLNYPAAVPADVLGSVADVVGRAVLALGVKDGAAHTEVILTAEGPFLVEAGARGGGGHIFSVVVEAVSGVDMVKETARVLVGETPDLRPRHRRGCVYRFFAPAPGILRAVHGLEAARSLPGVLDVGVLKKPGDRVLELVNSLERVGFAVVAGDDRSEAIRRADDVEAAIGFEMAAAS